MAGELEELLEKEALVGTFDSTGTFTLSINRARSKLQEFQLADLNQGVLKMIQALVQIEPSAIWIEADSQHFNLCWGDPKHTLSPDQFVSNFEQVLLGTGSPAKDMAIGLMAFLHLEPKEAWWGEWDGLAAKVTVNLFGGQKQAQLRTPPKMFAQTYSLTVQAGATSFPLNRQEISTRTTFAPIPILWNGRLLSELSWNPPMQPTAKIPYWADYYFTHQGPISQGLALKPNGSSLALAQGQNDWGDFGKALKPATYVRYVVGPRTHPLQLKGRQSRLSGMASLVNPGNAVGLPVALQTAVGESMWVLTSEMTGPSLLLPIKHGILLNPCNLPIDLSGVVVVMATPRLDVDLSQFTPIHNANWSDLKVHLNRVAQEIVSQLKDGMQIGTSSPEGSALEPVPLGFGIGWMVTSVFTPLPFWLGAMLGAAAAGVVGHLQIASKRRQRQHLLAQALGQLQAAE
ncbi:hypothetical protein IV102_03065 [bacterium]|nr:hypothetical protein [bacterium]